jgi:hypothetical protein
MWQNSLPEFRSDFPCQDAVMEPGIVLKEKLSFLL